MNLKVKLKKIIRTWGKVYLHIIYMKYVYSAKIWKGGSRKVAKRSLSMFVKSKI